VGANYDQWCLTHEKDFYLYIDQITTVFAIRSRSFHVKFDQSIHGCISY